MAKKASNKKPSIIEELEQIAQTESAQRAAQAKAAAEKEAEKRAEAVKQAAEYGRTGLFDELKKEMIKAAKELKREASVSVGTDARPDCAAATQNALLERLREEGLIGEPFSERHESWHDPDCGMMGWDGYSYHVRVKW